MPPSFRPFRFSGCMQVGEAQAIQLRLVIAVGSDRRLVGLDDAACRIDQQDEVAGQPCELGKMLRDGRALARRRHVLHPQRAVFGPPQHQQHGSGQRDGGADDHHQCSFPVVDRRHGRRFAGLGQHDPGHTVHAACGTQHRRALLKASIQTVATLDRLRRGQGEVGQRHAVAAWRRRGRRGWRRDEDDISAVAAHDEDVRCRTCHRQALELVQQAAERIDGDGDDGRRR